MVSSAIERTVLDFLTGDLFYDKDLSGLRETDSLAEREILDSLAILRIVTFCEETFGVEIPDTDVVPENFDSVRAISQLIERHVPKNT